MSNTGPASQDLTRSRLTALVLAGMLHQHATEKQRAASLEVRERLLALAAKAHEMFDAIEADPDTLGGRHMCGELNETILALNAAIEQRNAAFQGIYG